MDLNKSIVLASKVKTELAKLDMNDPEVKAYFVEKYARGATDIELAEFISTAIADEAIPGEDIYLLKFQKKDGGSYPATIVHSINWFTRKANESGDFVGFTEPEYQDDKGEWHAFWESKSQAPVACRIGVLKRGTPLVGQSIVRWDERFKNQGEWKNQPIHMLTKCAKAQALRDAGFKGCKGRYIQEEMYKDIPDGEWIPDPNKSLAENAVDAGRAAKARAGERSRLTNGDLRDKGAVEVAPADTKKINALMKDLGIKSRVTAINDILKACDMPTIEKYEELTADGAKVVISALTTQMQEIETGNIPPDPEA